MSANISKEKREELIGKIKAIETYLSSAPQDENKAQLLTYLRELRKEIGEKKYGLVFERHREAIDETLETHAPYLLEERELFLDRGGQMNFLIEGDNLAALEILKKTHKGRIDVIYIDPPYNTGNGDFIYDDSFVDPNDAFKHSKWLSFIEKRLIAAKELLGENGVIFISIDDNEQAVLKTLCDGIFGEANFITCFHWEKTQHFGRQKINFYSDCEYVLCYAKQLFRGKTKELLVERINRELTDAPLYNASNREKELTFPAGSVKCNLPDGKYSATDSVDYELLSPVVVKDGKNANSLRLKFKSRWSQETVDEEYKKGTTFWVKSKNFAIRTVYHDGKSSNVAPKALIFTNRNNPMVTMSRFREKVGVNENASAELSELVDDRSFSYPKPTSLIGYLLSLYYDAGIGDFPKDITVLDFFAGSGTTGHAVMKLNASDGGKRTFILCTNNENNICRNVTYERIKRAIERDNFSARLKYFRVGYLPISEKLYYEYADELLRHVKELIELENGIDLTGNEEVAILLTEEELDLFASSLSEETKCKAVYLGHDVLASDEEEELFRRYHIAINVIPDYYYRDLEG